MNTFRIAQIGSTERLDFSKAKILAPFANTTPEVDIFVESFALVDESNRVFHGSELEKRHQEAPYTILLLAGAENGGSACGEMLLQSAILLADAYSLPIFYTTDLEAELPDDPVLLLTRFNRRLALYENALIHTRQLNLTISEQNQQLQSMKSKVELEYNVIANSFFWKATKPLRWLCDQLKKVPPIRYFAKGLRYWRRHGTKGFFRKIRSFLSTKRGCKKRSTPDPKALEEQRNTTFLKNIKFSILVPLYNTPIAFLDEMIDSVVKQTYSNWELCLADGSDAEHANVGKRVMELAQNDSRILYKKLEKNLGISENTNACIDMASGEYISLFDHDDLLHPSALFEVMKVICEEDADFIYTDEATFKSPNPKKIITNHYKPDFAPDNLRVANYICHFTSFSRELLEQVGRFRAEYDGSQDHDMILRLTEKAQKIAHIPQILYYWRSHPNSVSLNLGSKSYAVDAGIHAVEDSLKRNGLQGTVESSNIIPTFYRVRYEVKTDQKVSIIIPNKDHLSVLKTCIDSILKLTTYPNYEIVIVDNGSSEAALFSYYEELKNHSNITVCSLDIPFNYSMLNNFAITHATGDYYLLLNNDIEIITPNWLEEMLMYAQRDDVGAVGAKLYYPDDTVQHAGVLLGVGGFACHAFPRFGRAEVGYMGRAGYAQNLSAVTAACMMVKASVWREVEGLDESFKVALNDIDLCLKIRKAGYLIVWTPHAEAYHYESKTRGHEDNPEKQARFESEVHRFQEKWKSELEAGDPYYNPNFSLDPSAMFMEK